MNKIAIITGIVMLGAGLAGGYAFSIYQRTTDTQSQNTPQTTSAREPAFYRNPMNPEVTSPVPAKDSMGMDYVPVYADSGKPSEREKDPVLSEPDEP